MLRLEEQIALRDLARKAKVSSLDARIAGVNQASSDDPDAGESIENIKKAVEDQVKAIEEAAEPDLERLFVEDEERPSCPFEVTPPGIPDATFVDAYGVPVDLQSNVIAHSEGGVACSVLSAVSRDIAAEWDERANDLTVALVVLGLAGFVLALAADSDRKTTSARWLLSVGCIGSLMGVVVAAAAPLRMSSTSARNLSMEQRERFAENVAAGRIDLATFDCDSVRGHLDDAIDIYPGYAPTYVDRADASSCENDNWLITPSTASDSLETDASDLQTSINLGSSDLSAGARLGWIDILRAFAGPDVDTDLLRKSIAVMQPRIRGLEGSSDSWLYATRLNLALAHLALDTDADADAGVAMYADAIRCLSPEASCPGGGIDDAFVRDWYRLSALSDLELLTEELGKTKLDSVRELIVGNAERPRRSGGVDTGDWELGVLPQQVQVVGTADVDTSIVWYYKAPGLSTWSVMLFPSASTLAPGRNMNLLYPTGHLLPSGDYRADVYVDGEMVDSLFEERSADDRVRRVDITELGLSAVLPSTWIRQASTYGVDVKYGPASGSETFITRRREGMHPPEGTELRDWLSQQLNQTVDEFFVGVTGGVDNEDPRYLGLDNVVVREFPEFGVWAATGYKPYAKDVMCGGAVFTAIVSDVDGESRAEVAQSLVLELSGFEVTPITGRHMTSGFSLEVPDGWTAADRPVGGTGSNFSARDCTTTSNVLATQTELEEPLTVEDDVKRAIAYYEANFSEFSLISQEAIELASGQRAVRIEYSWVNGEGDAANPVTQRQLFAIDGSKEFVMTITTRTGEAAATAELADDLISSFQIEDG
jgi:hypothetical protein